MNNRSWIGSSPTETQDTHLFLKRAQTNAKTALLIVRQDDPELAVEAVSQVQQACEKAIKAVMLDQGMPLSHVKDMGHNTIGAFVNLMAHILSANPSTKDVAQALLKGDSAESANILAKVVLSGRQNRDIRRKVVYAFKQMLPATAENTGNKALEVEEWRRLTRAFPPQVVEVFIEFHENICDKLRQYINEIPNIYADPRPLLAKEVNVETWMYNPAYVGLPRRSPGQELDTQVDSILADIAQQFLNHTMEQMSLHIYQRHWPETINLREVLFHISRWLSSLGWLFLCAIVTTPHATSSRYPAEASSTSTEIGSQHYTVGLGVVACISPLATHTNEAIRNLIRHYRNMESSYQQFIR